MLFLFDKGTDRERQVEVDYFNEQVTTVRLDAGKNTIVDETFVAPDLSAFNDNDRFETLEVTSNDGLTISLVSEYNIIVALVASYNDGGKYYTVSLALGVVDEPTEGTDREGQ